MAKIHRDGVSGAAPRQQLWRLVQRRGRQRCWKRHQQQPPGGVATTGLFLQRQAKCTVAEAATGQLPSEGKRGGGTSDGASCAVAKGERARGTLRALLLSGVRAPLPPNPPLFD